MIATDEMLTYEQVAQRLGVVIRTVQRIVQSGELPQPLTISRRAKRFKASWVGAYLQKQESAIPR